MYPSNAGNENDACDEYQVEGGEEEDGGGHKDAEEACMEAKEWEREEADLKEGEEHTVLPVESDGEEDGCDMDTGFQNFLDNLPEEHRTYLTNIRMGTCSCPDRVVVGFVCKHLFCALQHAGKDISALPKTVTEAPHLCVDLEIIQRDRCVMEGVVHESVEEQNLGDDGYMDSERDIGDSAGVEEHNETRNACNPDDARVPSSDEKSNSQVGTREAESALNRLLGHLKTLTALAHKGTLTNEQVVEFEEGARTLRDKMVGSEKKGIDSEIDFSQVGKERKRKVQTEVGCGADQTLQRRKPNEFEKQRGRGRPPQKKDTLPRTGNGDVSWQDIANMQHDM